MTSTTGVLGPPRQTGNPKKDAGIMQEYVAGLFQGLITEGRILDRVDAISQIETLNQTISNPPTQGEIIALQAKINEIITAAG